MTALGLTALVLAVIWIAVLTVVVMVLVREVAVLSARLDTRGGQAFVARDGPMIGRPLPEAVDQALAPYVRGDSGIYVLLLSAVCSPCHDLVKQLQKRTWRLDEGVVALVTGRHELAESIVSSLPPWVTIVRDPQAGELAKALSIQTTPFAVRIRAGRVLDKAYLHGVRDLLRLARTRDGRQPRPAAKVKAVGHAS